MASNIENQTETTLNESIDPEDLDERLSLRCIERAERSLVGFQKIRFSRGEIHQFIERQGKETRYTSVKLYRYHQHAFKKDFKDEDEAVKVITHILKIGVFKNLEICYGSLLIDFEELMDHVGEITATNIEIAYCCESTVIAILRKLKNGVKAIMMDVSSDLTPAGFKEILAIPQVQNARYWHIKNLQHWMVFLYNLNRFKTCEVALVAQMWIDKNSKIGSTFQLSTESGPESFNGFQEYFANRIVSKNEKRVRIRTNNPDRHILLECGTDEMIKEKADLGRLQFFRMMVISAKMKESEYDDNCAEWLCKIVPEIYYYADSESSSEPQRYGYDEYNDSGPYNDYEPEEEYVYMYI